MILLVFFPATTWTLIVSTGTSEHEFVDFDNIVDGRGRWRTKRYPSISRYVRDREISDTDYVHSDYYPEGLIARWRKFSNQHATESDSVWKFEINEISRARSGAATVVNVRGADWREAEWLYEVNSNYAPRGSGIPQSFRRNLCGCRIRRCGGIKRGRYGNVGDDSVESSGSLDGKRSFCGRLSHHRAPRRLCVHRIDRHRIRARAGFTRLNHEGSDRELSLGREERFKR